MENTITNRQLFFLIPITMSASTMNIMTTMVPVAGRGSWISLLIAAVVFAIAAFLIVRLNNKFEGMMLFEYSKILTGKGMAYFLGFFYIATFLIVAVFLNIYTLGLLQAQFYPDIPREMMLFIGVMVYGWIAYKGITNVCRFLEIIGVIALAVTVAIHVIMLMQGESCNILPFFNKAEVVDYLSAVKEASVYFVTLSVITIIPMTRKNGKKAERTAFWATIVLGLVYILVFESCVKILGIHNISNYEFPMVEAIKVVDAPMIERFDILFLTSGFLGEVAGTAIFYLVIVEYICKMFPKASRGWVVTITGVIQIILALLTMDLKNAVKLFESIYMPVGLVCTVLIPCLLLLIARYKKRVPQKG